MKNVTRFISILLFVSMLLTLCSCDKNINDNQNYDYSNVIDNPFDVVLWNNKTINQIMENSNNLKVNDLVDVPSNFYFSMINYENGYLRYSRNTAHSYLFRDSISDFWMYGQYLNRIDDNHVAMILKLRDGDNINFVVNIIAFYSNREQFANNEATSVTRFVNEWTNCGEIYFINNKLSSSDYDKINVGDSEQSFLDIDPKSYQYQDVYYADYDEKTIVYDLRMAASLTMVSLSSTYYKMLTDGILVVKIKDSKVASKEFFKYGSEMPENIRVRDSKMIDFIFDNQ